MKLLIPIFFLALSNLSSAGEFSYRDTHSWARHWPACGGRRQSPIDISMSTADYSQQDNKLKLLNYDVVPRAMRLVNDGHAVKIIYEWGDQVPTVSGGILTSSYRLDSLIFHWNNKGIEGSEHTFNKTRGVMELQYLHYNTDYESVKEAFHHDNGLVMLADLFFTESFANSSYQSPLIRELFDQFSQVSHPGSSINLKNRFAILAIAPPTANDLEWIIYPGSLTIPPCTENVMWIVNTYAHLMDHTQLQHIQNTVQFSHHDDHNFRDIQELNGRKQYAMYTEPILPV